MTSVTTRAFVGGDDDARRGDRVRACVCVCLTHAQWCEIAARVVARRRRRRRRRMIRSEEMTRASARTD